MIAVLISVQPRWCEKVSSRDKTDELRKNAPKLPVPFKCYIYQTNAMWGYPILRALGMNKLLDKLEAGKGKIIGEFICDKIEQIDTDNTKRISASSCVSIRDMWEYARPKSMYDLKAWHISNLQIYDKAKDLSEFTPHCRYMTDDMQSCDYRKVACNHQVFDHNPWPDCTVNAVTCKRRLQRAPQSWCYVEELAHECQ